MTCWVVKGTITPSNIAGSTVVRAIRQVGYNHWFNDKLVDVGWKPNQLEQAIQSSRHRQGGRRGKAADTGTGKRKRME